MDHRVNLDIVFPSPVVIGVGQFALDDQICGLEVVTLLGQLFDGVATIAKDAFVAIDERDATAARCGVYESRVVGHQPEIVGRCLDCAQRGGPNHAAFFDWNFVALAGPVVDYAETVLCHRPSTEKILRPAPRSRPVNIYAVMPVSS